jgi:hypothetical protein
VRERPVAGLGALLLVCYTRARDRSRRAQMDCPPVLHRLADRTAPARSRVMSACAAVVVWRKRDSGFAETSEAAYESARALGVAAAWSWLELAAAVWTERAQRLSAGRAKCAFVATDESITFRRKRRATALALLLHLESHAPNVTVPPPPPLRLRALIRVTSRRAECDLSCGSAKTRERPALLCCQE